MLLLTQHPSQPPQPLSRASAVIAAVIISIAVAVVVIIVYPMVDCYLNCSHLVTVVVCFNKCVFCEIENKKLCTIVLELEPFFSFVSVSTVFLSKHYRQVQLPKHASLSEEYFQKWGRNAQSELR